MPESDSENPYEPPRVAQDDKRQPEARDLGSSSVLFGFLSVLAVISSFIIFGVVCTTAGFVGTMVEEGDAYGPSGAVFIFSCLLGFFAAVSSVLLMFKWLHRRFKNRY